MPERQEAGVVTLAVLDVAPWDSHSQVLKQARPEVFRLVLRFHTVLCLAASVFYAESELRLCTSDADRVDDEEGEMTGRRTLDLCTRQTDRW